MKVIIEGHRYALGNFDDKSSHQSLQFIQKTPVTEGSKELKTVNDGTTNEEVLAVLIDRMQYLNGKFPCRDNSIAITHLEDALLRLNKRTADRLVRGVEGKHLK